MKIALCSLMLLAVVPAVQAQKSQKELKKELTAKVDKDSKKEAKKMVKEGWKTMPGNLPIEKQIQRSRYARLDTDENGEPLYFVATGRGIGGSYAGAKDDADLQARAFIVNEIDNLVQKTVDGKRGTSNFGPGEVETISETVAASRSEVSARLQGLTPVLEIYKESRNQFEVELTLTVDRKKAIRFAQGEYRKELLKKSEKLAESFDRIMEE